MKLLLSLVLLFACCFSYLFADEIELDREEEAAPSPIYVLAPQMQADWVPSPFPRKNIYWNPESAKKLIIDAKEGLILFLSGKLKNADLYLADFKLPVDNGKFQFHLPLTKESGSFLFTLENNFGERITYRLNYFWLKYPSTQFNVKIKDAGVITEQKMDRKGEFNTREWLIFSWQPAESPIPPQSIFQRIKSVGYFKSVEIAGTMNLQSGGGQLTSVKLAYSPYFDFNPYGARFELGISPLKNKDGNIFMALNYQVFGRYNFLEKYTAELGLGAVTFTGSAGGSALTTSIVGRRKLSLISFQRDIFLGYSMLMFDPSVNQFEIGTTFVF